MMTGELKNKIVDGGPPAFLRRFLVSRSTLDTTHSLDISPTRFSLSATGLPMPFGYVLRC